MALPHGVVGWSAVGDCSIFFIILTCLFTTDSEWDCVAAVKLIPVLLYIVDYTCISLSFGTMASIVEL